jgi:hypothetical protein
MTDCFKSHITGLDEISAICLGASIVRVKLEATEVATLRDLPGLNKSLGIAQSWGIE